MKYALLASHSRAAMAFFLVLAFGYAGAAAAALSCPPGAIFPQPPDPGLPPGTPSWFSSEGWNNFIAADDFMDLPEPFNQVTWWGSAEGIGDVTCDRAPDDFRILIFEDEDGLPGEELLRFTVTPESVDTGFLVGERIVLRYTATLPEPVNEATGWIAIQGVGDLDCNFLWLSTDAATGNGRVVQDVGDGWVERAVDFSLCLSTTEIADPEVPIVRYVRPHEIPTAGDGSEAQPWGSISYALNQIAPLGAPVTLNLAPGLYDEDLTLVPDVTLRGVALAPREADLVDRLLEGDIARIRGQIIAAPGATLEDLSIEAPAEGSTLLWSEVQDLTVRRVMFEGTAARTPFGIVLRGDTSGTLIEESRFELLDVALDIGGPLPRLRRSVFDNQGETHLLLRALGTKVVGEATGLGYEGDANAGFNVFGSTTTGIAVINDRDEAILMQLNEWGTEVSEEVAARIGGTGEVIFEPFLPVGNAILAGAIFCTVIDAASETPVTDAEVTLTPAPYAPVTDNVNGLYPFSAIFAGNYTLSVEHAEFDTVSRAVTVSDGETVSIVVRLPAHPGEGPKAPVICGLGTDSGASHGGGLLTLLLMASVLAGLGFAGRRRAASRI